MPRISRRCSDSLHPPSWHLGTRHSRSMRCMVALTRGPAVTNSTAPCMKQFHRTALVRCLPCGVAKTHQHTSCDAGVQAEHLNAPIYCEVREPVEAHGRSHTFGGNAAISRGLLFCAAPEPASSTHARRRAGLRAQEYCAYIPTARLLLFQNMFGCNGRQASALCDWRLSSRCS